MLVIVVWWIYFNSVVYVTRFPQFSVRYLLLVIDLMLFDLWVCFVVLALLFFVFGLWVSGYSILFGWVLD